MRAQDGRVGQDDRERGLELVRRIRDEPLLLVPRRATGPSAQREKNTLMTRNTARAPTPTAASVRASDCQEDAALASAKATNVVPPTARFE